MATVYASCDTANIDPSSGQCTQVVWVDASPTWIQPLSISDGELIGAAGLVVWAIAYGFVALRRVISAA